MAMETVQANLKVAKLANKGDLSALQFELVLKTLVCKFRTVKRSNWPLFTLLCWFAQFSLAHVARISHKTNKEQPHI